jgi:hypothetical protein
MGEFLSKPILDKVSEDNENEFVKKYKLTKNNNRFDMDQVECKDGEKEWKTHIFLI